VKRTIEVLNELERDGIYYAQGVKAKRPLGSIAPADSG
jgi:hypothetical protein